MFDTCAKLALAVALAGAAVPTVARADAGDDQYAVAAGHYARDRWQLAITEFRAYREKFPRHAKLSQALFFEAEAHVQLDQFREAVDLFQQHLQREPQSRYHRQALFRWGESSYLLKDHAAARPVLEEFRRTYAKDKLNAYVLAYLGQIALAAKEHPAAKEFFDASLKDFPESPAQDECRFGLACIAEEQGDTDSAERTYLALGAKTASPWADDALLRLGGLHYARGEYDAAIQTLSELETTFKTSDLVERARLSRGWAHFKQDQRPQAAALFQSLQQSKSVGLEARYWLGLTHKADKNWKLAAETLLAASEVEEQHALTPAMAFHAGDSLARAGQASAALEQFERVLQAEIRGEWADDALLGKLQLARAAGEHQQVDLLAAGFLQHFAQSDLTSEARRLHAQSLLVRKKFDQAATLFKDVGEKASLADRYLLAAAQYGLSRNEDSLGTLAPVLKEAEGRLLADARLLAASVYVEQKQYAAAIEPLEAHLAADAQGVDAARCRAQLAACYARIKELDKARRVFTELQKQTPPAELRHSATQQLAEAVFAAGDYVWSGTLFESISAKEEPAAVAVRGLSGWGWSRYRAGELDAAAAAFAQLLERYPQQQLAAEAALTRGQILERLERPQEALAMYQRLIDQYPQDERLPLALLAAGRMSDKLGQDAEAALLYARFAKEFPQHESLDAALYEAAWVLRELNRHEESDSRFSTLYQEHRTSRFWPDAAFRLAERAQAARRYEEVQRLLTDLVATQPDQKLLPHVLYLQGQAAAGRQQWPEVIAAMKPLIEAADDSPFKLLASYWTAEALYRQGDFTGAGERLTDLAAQTRDSREGWTAMVALRQAQVLAHQKKWKEAHDLAASIAPRWPAFDQQHEADYIIGRALAARGELTDARTAYERVLRSETGGKTETAAMAQWMIGESYFHQKNYESALREYLRLEILYAYPAWQAAALLQAGKCSEHLGQWKQAVEMYQRLVKEFSETSFVEEAQLRLAAARERLANR